MSAPDSEAHRRAVEKYRARQRAAGRCIQCGAVRQVGSRARCRLCLALNRDQRYETTQPKRALGEGRRPWRAA